MDCGDIIFVLTNSASPPAFSPEGGGQCSGGGKLSLEENTEGPGVNNGGNI